MRAINRTVVILLLAGLFTLGVFAVVYAIGLFGYRLADLPVPGIAGGVEAFAQDIEGGNPSPLAVAALVAVAVVGLVLLVAELKPRTPRRVRMGRGTYVTRGVVKERAEEAAMAVPEVLESSARVKARRRPGARVELGTKVRRGQDAQRQKKAVRDQVKERLGGGGVPVGQLKVEVAEIDPRRAKTRVK